MYAAYMQTREQALEGLDSALNRLRRFWQRPAVRAFVRARLEPDVDSTIYRALAAVQLDEPAAVGDVAERLEIEASTASRVVDRVVSAGYVHRAHCADDRRRYELVLTEAGRELLERLREARLALLEELTDDWSAAETATLTRLLDRLEEACQKLEQP